jgi:histidinol-phosphate aminotransferase
MFNLDNIIRPNVKRMKPYSSARDEFSGNASIWLDANENPYPGSYNRYPDPRQRVVKQHLAEVKGVSPENIFMGNGSDEAIDLLFRAFCEPGKDKVLLFPPTYGMYQVCAALNDVETIEVPLSSDFQLDIPKAKEVCLQEKPKMLFICSPNNPTGNLIPQDQIIDLAKDFPGIVVVDEAYIDFATEGSMVPFIPTAYAEQPEALQNLVVLQTFSKAWGMAGIRLGMALASEAIIDIFNKIKPPYNVNQVTQEIAWKALRDNQQIIEKVKEIQREKAKLAQQLLQLEVVEAIYPSDANFLLVRFKYALSIFQHLQQKGIIIRDRTRVVPDCLRITIGTPEENQTLIEELSQL